MPSPLRSSRLRRILVAYTINRLGTWFGLVALSLAVFDHTQSALAVAAMLFAGQALPAFLVPAIVARVEASERRRELSALYLFEAVVTAGLAVLLWHFSLPAILVLVALDGTAALAASALLRSELARTARAEVEREPAAWPRPAEQADQHEAPDRPPADRAEEAERRANAALNVAFSITFVLGPVIGGAVVAAAGPSAALFIDVGSFVVCAALLRNLHPHVEQAGGDSVRARLRAAWRHINEAPSLRSLLIVEAIALVFFESGGPIEVAYAKATLHVGDRGYGLLLTTWGAGAVLGSVVFARLVRRSLAAMLRVGTLAIGGAYIGFAGAPTLALACAAALLGGVGNGLQWPSMISTVQRITPQKLQGRMMGGLESLGALCLAIGLPLGGVLVAVSSPRVAFLAVGIGAVATTAALLRLSAWRSPPAPDGLTAAPLLADQPGMRDEP